MMMIIVINNNDNNNDKYNDINSYPTNHIQIYDKYDNSLFSLFITKPTERYY